MSNLSYKESRNIAVSLVNGIRNSLLISVENDMETTNSSTDMTSRERYPEYFESYSSFQSSYEDRCKDYSSSCVEYENNKLLSRSKQQDSQLSVNSAASSFDGMGYFSRQENRLLSKIRDDFSSYDSSSNLPIYQGKELEHEIESKSQTYVKQCPQCFEFNDQDSNWCLECGKAIISVEVRRSDSLRREKLKHSLCQNKSQSYPRYSYKASVSLEEESVSEMFSWNESATRTQCHSFTPEFNATNYDDYSVPFDFQNPKLEDETITSNSDWDHNALYHKVDRRQERKPDIPHLYAFDDLLYPNYAIQDPVYGFVLPSSNIVSNGLQFQPSLHQTGNLYRNNEVIKPQFEEESRRTIYYKKQKKQKKKRRKQKNVPTENSKKITEKTIAANYVYSNTLESSSTDVKEAEDDELSILNLPEEVILYILSLLSVSEVAKCARVCNQFCRLSSDHSLWRKIIIKKNNKINDSVLAKVARKQPTNLTITQCNGKDITMDGLRTLFRSCAESLQALDVSACSGGVLVGETILLHMSSRCHKINKLDVSWSNVSDTGVQAVCKALERLEEFTLNGCQGISDDAIKSISENHGESLKVLEVFGCFNISPVSITSISKHCKNLRKLNLGQCHKVKNQSLSMIAKNLKCLESLDLRGCKQIRDIALKEIISNCEKLTNLVIANCYYITDNSLVAIAYSLPDLSSLDACGCGKVTDRGVSNLVKYCKKLQLIDLSSTKITGKSVTTIAHHCQNLAALKLSFCHSITESCLQTVVSKCTRLKTLHLYGCKPIRNLHKLMEINPNVNIEKESLR